jgi:hypothetical protein
VEDIKFIIESQSPEAALARKMIGTETLALMLAKAAVSKFRNVDIDKKVVQEVFGMSSSGAWKKVTNIAVRGTTQVNK